MHRIETAADNRPRSGRPPSFTRPRRHHASRPSAHRGRLAIKAGANVKAVQQMLGHASAAMTLDVYAGLFHDDLDHVASALDTLMQSSLSLPSSSLGRANR